MRWSLHSPDSRRGVRRFRPRLEALENRLVPSSSSGGSGSLAVSLGDQTEQHSGSSGGPAFQRSSGSNSGSSGGPSLQQSGGSNSGSSGGLQQSSGSNSGSGGGGGGQFIIVNQVKMVTISGPGYPQMAITLSTQVSVNSQATDPNLVLVPLQGTTLTSAALSTVLVDAATTTTTPLGDTTVQVTALAPSPAIQVTPTAP